MSAATQDLAVSYFLPASLGLMTFAMGLGLNIHDFKILYSKPKATIVGVLGQLLLLPILAFGLAILFQLPAPSAIGLVLLAACPGGAHSNLMANLAKGDVALSVALTALSGLACVITIPAYVYLATSWFTSESTLIALSFKDTFLQLLSIVIIPLMLGMLLRHGLKEKTHVLEKIIKGFAVFLLALIILGAAANSFEKVMSYAKDIGLAVISLNIIAMGLGALLAKWATLPGKQVATLTMEVGVQNTTLAFALAMTVLDSLETAIPAMVYALWVYIAALIVIIISRKLLGTEAP